MAKPFYSMEEVCAKLGKTPDQIRELVRAGTLREFRDAGKIFFKSEDVEQLTGGGPAKGDSGEILLEPVEETLKSAPGREADLPPLVSPGSGGTSIIGLEPLEEEKKAEHKEDTTVSTSGIGVFDEDEVEIDADPMAKTQITAGAIDDQVSLEGSGSSGSGLLDLTRESDDTSLGAELLDEIYPGEETAAAAEPEPRAKAKAPPPRAPVAEEKAEAEPVLAEAAAGAVLVPTAEVGDPLEGLFAGFLVASLILMAVGASVVGGVLQGYLPDFARGLTNYFWLFLGGASGIVLLSAGIGWFLGRAMIPRSG